MQVDVVRTATVAANIISYLTCVHGVHGVLCVFVFVFVCAGRGLQWAAGVCNAIFEDTG